MPGVAVGGKTGTGKKAVACGSDVPRGAVGGKAGRKRKRGSAPTKQMSQRLQPRSRRRLIMLRRLIMFEPRPCLRESCIESQ